jgi:hypothetical protein
MTGTRPCACFNRGANDLKMFRRSQRIHFTGSARGYHGANLMFKKLRQIVSQAINIERQIALERSDRKSDYAGKFMAQLSRIHHCLRFST